MRVRGDDSSSLLLADASDVSCSCVREMRPLLLLLRQQRREEYNSAVVGIISCSNCINRQESRIEAVMVVEATNVIVKQREVRMKMSENGRGDVRGLF